ncbi:MAG TPA: hypothetical protein VEW07_12330 [Solirubrobacterales bacterium]|nr:hypothetical protein [Solirubrobacterales bacterium]
MPSEAAGEAADAATFKAMEAGATKLRRGTAMRSDSTPSKARSWPEVGHLAPIVLSTGLGLALCSLANALSRATLEPALPVYWIGILVLALPIFYRLTASEASARERLILVCLLGLSLYCVKVFRDAPLFTFSDELIHAFNANQIADHHHLFRDNPILAATPYYPGLEGATSALMKLTGLSVYAAGTILVGAARLVLIASLFLLFQRVSGSARVAGLGAAIYAGNFNFLFWGAQFSYESLALPLLLLAMMALAEREVAPKQALRAWGAPVVLAMMAIVVTHHLTSYAVAGLLVGLSLAYWYVHRRWSPPNPWPFAILGILLAAFWLFVVASSTVGYLSPVLSDAFDAIGNTIGGEDEPRGLFQAGSTSVAPTPLGARAVALAAVALLAAGLPFGLRALWRRHRRQPFALLFGIAAVAFFATLALRLAPAAWETANRASEFLFIGLAFVLACACVEALRRRPRDRRTRPLIAAGIGLVLVGGAISGWPWDSQLARPLRISTAGETISSPPLALAEWAEEMPEGRFAASTADAGLLLVPGGKMALAGSSPPIEDVLDEEELAGWMLPMLRRNKIRYIAVDRREVSSDSLRGYYFSRRDKDEGLRPPSVSAKFNAVPGISRVYTNGPITVFDLGAQR